MAVQREATLSWVQPCPANSKQKFLPEEINIRETATWVKKGNTKKENNPSFTRDLFLV